MIIDVLVDPILKNTFRKFFSIYAGSKFWPGKLFERVQYHVLDLVRTYNFGPTYFLRNRPKLQFRTKTESGSQLQFGTCSEISKTTTAFFSPKLHFWSRIWTPDHVSTCNFKPLSDLVRNCNFGPFRKEKWRTEIAFLYQPQHVILNSFKKISGPKFGSQRAEQSTCGTK